MNKLIIVAVICFIFIVGCNWIQSRYTSDRIQQWKDGQISKEDANTRLINIRRGGGGTTYEQVEQAELIGEKITAQLKARGENGLDSE